MKRIKENEEFVFGNNVFTLSFEGHNIKLSRIRLASSKPPKKEFTPPTLDEVKDYFKAKGYTSEAAVKFHEYYSAGEPPWSDAKGKPIRSWKQKAMAVWFRDENKIKKNNDTQTIDFFGNK